MFLLQETNSRILYEDGGHILLQDANVETNGDASTYNLGLVSTNDQSRREDLYLEAISLRWRR